MAEENEERPKVSKTEEKESFIKQLDERIAKLSEVEERIKAVTERNEELAARHLLGGKSGAGIQPEPVKEADGTEYIKKIQQGFKGL